MIRSLRDRHRRMIPWLALITALLLGWALGSVSEPPSRLP